MLIRKEVAKKKKQEKELFEKQKMKFT